MTRRIKGLSNRQKTWLWILGTTAVVFCLLYFEQIAILYLLATIAITGLLLIVGWADLGDAHTPAVTVASAEQTLAIESPGTATPAAPKSTFGSRPRKRRG